MVLETCLCGRRYRESFRDHCLEVELIPENDCRRPCKRTGGIDNDSANVFDNDNNSQKLVQMLEDVVFSIVDTTNI